MIIVLALFYLSQKEKSIHKKSYVRVNSNIRAAEVRLVDDKGEMLGVKNIQEAMRIAQDTSLDLIEVAPNAKPPVCKLGNFSKYLYEKAKKKQGIQKKQRGWPGQRSSFSHEDR